MKFTELPIHKNIQKGVEKAGFNEIMPVQEQTFVESFNGRDVLVQSQTGSGKTAAFLITIFHLFLTNKVQRKKALIISPTRELALQIEEEAKLLGAYLDLKIGCFYGGVGYDRQEQLLRNGVDIIVGTPGRLLDFSQSGKLQFSGVGIFVIDEADRLFDMGFYPDLQRILRKLPPHSERMTMLFSATLDTRVRNLAWKYMKDPAEIEIDPEQVTVGTVIQELYHTSKDEKFSLLLGILKREKPKNVLIFTNMKVSAAEVAWRLEKNGFSCQYIMGDLPQKKRSKIIESMKKGEIPLLVATDVAARGLHIDDLELVINYDMPQDRDNYVHRIGRTARTGKSGKAISLACEEYVFVLESIESYIGMKIPVVWADDSLIVPDKAARERFPGIERNNRKQREPRREQNRKPADRRKKREPQTTSVHTTSVRVARGAQGEVVHEQKKTDTVHQNDQYKKKRHRRRGGSHGRKEGFSPTHRTDRTPGEQIVHPIQEKTAQKKKGLLKRIIDTVIKKSS